jgi:hypothetical protein
MPEALSFAESRRQKFLLLRIALLAAAEGGRFFELV